MAKSTSNNRSCTQETVWAIRYYGTEASSGATSIAVNYSNVVPYSNFTGVVTFSSGTTLSDGTQGICYY